jgi:hypothetical protein
MLGEDLALHVLGARNQHTILVADINNLLIDWGMLPGVKQPGREDDH